MKYLLILLSFLSVMSFADTASVQEYWIAPTAREGGAKLAISEIYKYVIRYRLVGTADYTTIEALPPALSVRIDNLQYGNYEIQYSAIDKDLKVSKWSVLALFTVGVPPAVESYIAIKYVK